MSTVTDFVIPDGVKSILPPERVEATEKALELLKVTAEALGMTPTRVKEEKEKIFLANLTAFTVTPPPAPRKESALLKEWTSAELLRKEVVQTYKWAAEIAPAFQQWEALNDAFAGDSKWKDLRQNAMEAARLNLLAPVEILLLSHLLFEENKEFGAFTVAHMILRTPPNMTYQTHNAAMVLKEKEANRGYLASRVASALHPIYPPLPDADLNLSLLQSSTATGLSGGAPGGFPELPEHSRFDVPGSLRGGDYVAPIFDSTGAHTASVDLTQLERYIVRCQENNDAGLVELRNYLRELQKAGRANTGRDNRSASRPTGTNNYYSGRYPNVGVRGRGRGGRGGYRGGEAPEGDTLTGMSTSATTPLQMQGN